MNIKFELVGIQPLLMHWDNIEGGDMVREWIRDPENKNVSVAGDDRSPPWTWQTYCYNDGENVVIPSANLMSCLKTAGARKTLKGNKTFKEVTQTGILIPTEYLILHSKGKLVPWAKIVALREREFKNQSDAVKDLGFELFMKRAKPPGRSGKHVRIRPRFNEWSIHGEADILDQSLTMEVIKEIFGLAGRVGLGDWRPGCNTPGPFGQFEAKLKKG